MHTNILIKNMYDAFGMRKQAKTIYLGDLSKELTMSLLRSLEKIIEKYPEREKYYLLVHSRFDAVSKHDIKTVVTVLPDSIDPEKYKTLATMMFHVDNRRGKFTKIWVLPLDRPVLGGLLTGAPVESIARDAIGMPVKAMTH